MSITFRQWMGLGLVLVVVLVLALVRTLGCSSPESETSDTAAQTASSSTQFFEISIQSDQTIRVDGQEVSLTELGARVTEAVGQNRDRAVIKMACGEGVSMRIVHAVHEVLRRDGLLRVSYTALSGNDLPLVLPSANQRERARSIPREHFADLRVAASGEMSLDRQAITIPEIRGAIRDRLSRDDKLIVAISTETETRYGDFVSALEEVKGAGAQRIQITDPELRF